MALITYCGPNWSKIYPVPFTGKMFKQRMWLWYLWLPYPWRVFKHGQMNGSHIQSNITIVTSSWCAHRLWVKIKENKAHLKRIGARLAATVLDKYVTRAAWMQRGVVSSQQQWGLRFGTTLPGSVPLPNFGFGQFTYPFCSCFLISKMGSVMGLSSWGCCAD